jgi:hypothetical protein
LNLNFPFLDDGDGDKKKSNGGSQYYWALVSSSISIHISVCGMGDWTQGLYLLNEHPNTWVFFCLLFVFWDRISSTLLGMASNLRSFCLYLPHRWDYSWAPDYTLHMCCHWILSFVLPSEGRYCYYTHFSKK